MAVCCLFVCSFVLGECPPRSNNHLILPHGPVTQDPRIAFPEELPRTPEYSLSHMPIRVFSNDKKVLVVSLLWLFSSVRKLRIKFPFALISFFLM